MDVVNLYQGLLRPYHKFVWLVLIEFVIHSRAKCEKSDGDISISGSASEQQTSNIISPGKENRVENNLAEKSETAINGKSSDGAPIYSHQRCIFALLIPYLHRCLYLCYRIISSWIFQ